MRSLGTLMGRVCPSAPRRQHKDTQRHRDTKTLQTQSINQSGRQSIFFIVLSPHRRATSKPFTVVFTDIESSSLLWGRVRTV